MAPQAPQTQKRGNGETLKNRSDDEIQSLPLLSTYSCLLCLRRLRRLLQFERHEPAPVTQIQFCSSQRRRSPRHGFEKGNFSQRP